MLTLEINLYSLHFNKYLKCVIFHVGCFILALKFYLYQLVCVVVHKCILAARLEAPCRKTSILSKSRYFDFFPLFVWMKTGPHTKPDKLRGGLHGGLTDSETNSGTTQDGPKFLGRYFSLTKVNLYLH